MHFLQEERKLKQTTSRNPVVMPAMVCFNFSDESGKVSKKHIEHYEARAKGGTGFIVQEATCVHPHGKLHPSQLGLWSDDQIPGAKQLVDAVHRYDVPILAQIHHAGILTKEAEVWAPSEMPYKGRKVKAIPTSRIEEFQSYYVEAVSRAYKAGYDGVELHGCHSFLISQFLNKNVNKRDDEYGDGLKFVEGIFNGIKQVVPEEFIVTARLGAFEPTLDDGIHHAKAFESMGFDALNISYGFNALAEAYAPADYPHAPPIYGAEQIAKEVDIPVWAVYGINTPEEAEDVLSRGIDRVNIGRAQLVNPRWVQDVLEGKNPGRCLYCQDGCYLYGDFPVCRGHLALKKQRPEVDWVP